MFCKISIYTFSFVVIRFCFLESDFTIFEKCYKASEILSKQFSRNRKVAWDFGYQISLFRSSHQRHSIKKLSLEILQNSQESTCAGVYFLLKLQASACNSIKKQTLAQVFSCEFCEIFKNTFFTEHLQATASLCSCTEDQ